MKYRINNSRTNMNFAPKWQSNKTLKTQETVEKIDGYANYIKSTPEYSLFISKAKSGRYLEEIDRWMDEW